jgi:hypothetical protein
MFSSTNIGLQSKVLVASCWVLGRRPKTQDAGHKGRSMSVKNLRLRLRLIALYLSLNLNL